MTFSKKLMIKVTSSDVVASLFIFPKFPDSLCSSIKESSIDCYKEKSMHTIQVKVFSSIKPLISNLESSKDNESKTQIIPVIQMLCSTNLDISILRRVFATPFFKPEYKKSFLKLSLSTISLRREL